MIELSFLQWIALIAGVYMAWNIGANDVSNAMGTSVGSKALTLKKAVLLAAILEFCGAFFLGDKVSGTIMQGLINPFYFEKHPLTFALGMTSALLATGFWLHFACYLKMPVSTTHSIVGAIIGFGLVTGGLRAIYWKSVGQIVGSWMLTPLLSGLISYLIFSILQRKILFSTSPLNSTKKFFPVLTFFTFFFLSLIIVYKGYIYTKLNLSPIKVLVISLFISLLFARLGFLFIKRIGDSPKKAYHAPEQLLYLEKASKHLLRAKLASEGELCQKTSALLDEVKQLSKELKKDSELWENTSEYTQVERSFIFLQIVTACSVAFAHGANDVANAIGPVAAVLQTIRSGLQSFTASSIPVWILALGGVGIVFGLATWGWRVIETVGKKITELTPTRGFSAEFGAAITILLASKLGMPISTTHALVGAVLGVGFARGLEALNLKTIRDIVLSWIVTIPLSAIICIILFYLLRPLFS